MQCEIKTRQVCVWVGGVKKKILLCVN